MTVNAVVPLSVAPLSVAFARSTAGSWSGWAPRRGGAVLSAAPKQCSKRRPGGIVHPEILQRRAASTFPSVSGDQAQ